MAPQVAATTTAPVVSFTVREYRVYQALMDTPMSVSEAEGQRRIARRLNAPRISSWTKARSGRGSP